MHETFPIAAGILIGLVGGSVRQRRFTTAALAVLAVSVGFVAAIASGEYELSWGFVVFDVGQVVVVAMLAARLATLRLRRAGARRSQPG